MFRTLTTLLTLIAFTGCTTLQPLADVQPATIRQAVQPGDTVEVERTDGTQLTLKVEQVTDDMLVGTGGGLRHQVPLASIRSIGERTMTTSSKVWTAVGVVAVIGGIIAATSSDGGGGGGGSGY